METWNKTALKLLDAAEQMIKVRGFNAFSFRDLQQEVGVKTSTIHYYFSTKTDLADAAVAKFFDQHKLALHTLDQEQPSTIKRLLSVADFFVANAKKGEFCLGGMLTSDLRALDNRTSARLGEFFQHFHQWLEDTLIQGIDNGEISPGIDPAKFSRVFIASLEGGMLISRVSQDDGYYQSLLSNLIEQLNNEGVQK